MKAKDKLVSYALVSMFLIGTIISVFRWNLKDMWFGVGVGMLLTLMITVFFATMQFGLQQREK